jgi:hypothetical protein
MLLRCESLEPTTSLLGHKPRRRSGPGPVYVRSTSDRVEVLCTAVKDAKCHKPTYAVQQIALFNHLVGALANL